MNPKHFTLLAVLALAGRSLAASPAVPTRSSMRPTPEQVVRDFYAVVRSGRAPERASEFLAAQVPAHQINAEAEEVIVRSPAQYAAHVREMQAAYGPFALEVSELIAQGDKVYVRWRQRGVHVGEVDGFRPTGKPVLEIGSAVYRVEAGKIAEYWVQLDRAGIRAQLERNAKNP